MAPHTAASTTKPTRCKRSASVVLKTEREGRRERRKFKSAYSIHVYMPWRLLWLSWPLWFSLGFNVEVGLPWMLCCGSHCSRGDAGAIHTSLSQNLTYYSLDLSLSVCVYVCLSISHPLLSRSLYLSLYPSRTQSRSLPLPLPHSSPNLSLSFYHYLTLTHSSLNPSLSLSLSRHLTHSSLNLYLSLYTRHSPLSQSFTRAHHRDHLENSVGKKNIILFFISRMLR